MKKLVHSTLIIMLVFVLVPAAIAQDLKVISLKWSDHAPPTAGGNVFMKQEWVPRVNEQLAKIGYKLDVTYYHASSLYKYGDQVQALENELIDFTLFVPSYEIARAPLHEVLTFPLMGYDSYGASRMWFELHEAIPEFGAEFSKYKEVFHWLPMPAVLNANKVMRVPADFKGVKIQASGMMGDMMRSIGAVPIRQAPADWYTSLERGLIEAINVGLYGVTLFKLHEVVKVHIIPTGDNFGFPATTVIMNRKKYESLPSSVRKVINDQVQWASDRMTAIDDAHNPEAEEICRKLGHTFVQLTPEEMKLWYDAVRPHHEEWIKKMEAKGLPGRKVLEGAKQLAKKYAK
jgi:TRAP-type C4-dicarboxylate transport system substrate-binding protein